MMEGGIEMVDNLKNIVCLIIGIILFYSSFVFGESTLAGGLLHLSGCTFFCAGFHRKWCLFICPDKHEEEK
jgi:hypothetical protein